MEMSLIVSFKMSLNGMIGYLPTKSTDALNHDEALGKSPILFIIPHEFSENVQNQIKRSQSQSDRFRFNDPIIANVRVVAKYSV